MQTYKRRLSFQQLRAKGNNNIFEFLPDNQEYFFTESVRGGLEVVIERIWPDKNITVMLPVFVAEGVIRPFKNNNASVVFYKLNKDLSPDIDDIKTNIISNPGINCVLVVHYFGFVQNLTTVKEICSLNHCILLEDCVHALFSKDKYGDYVGTSGDISFFSFPKILQVPDGGVFFINNSELSPLLKNIRYHKSLAGFLMVRIHLLYLLLKNIEVRLTYSLFYRLINILSKALYVTYYSLLKHTRKPQRISETTLKILRNIDYSELITQRKKHTLEIYKALQPVKDILFSQDYDTNFLLTGVPLVSINCDKIVNELRKNNIECLSYKKSWFYMPEDKRNEYQSEYYFFQHHFLLPVHENNADYTQALQKAFK